MSLFVIVDYRILLAYRILIGPTDLMLICAILQYRRLIVNQVRRYLLRDRLFRCRRHAAAAENLPADLSSLRMGLHDQLLAVSRQRFLLHDGDQFLLVTIGHGYLWGDNDLTSHLLLDGLVLLLMMEQFSPLLFLLFNNPYRRIFVNARSKISGCVRHSCRRINLVKPGI